MSAHTPGPWHWDSDAVKNDPYGRVRYRVCTLGKTITQVYYSSFEGGLTNADADARLIAAAPDLLAALIRVLDEYNGVIDPDRNGLQGFDSYSEVVAARAAIAKATEASQ